MTKLYKIDGVLWEEDTVPSAYCPRHRVEMDPITFDEPFTPDSQCRHLRCEECKEDYEIPRDFEAEQQYVSRKIESRELKNIRVLNLDDEAIPLAKDKTSSKDGRYFATVILTESRVGQRLVVYAGERGKKEKTQIFVEPSIKRLSFDQKDAHPLNVFVKLEATFRNGEKSSMKKTSSGSQ